MDAVPVERDKAAPIDLILLYPRFADSRFEKRQTVFLAQGQETIEVVGFGPGIDGCSYYYSDELYRGFGREAIEVAWRDAESRGLPENSAALFEAFLRKLLFDPSLELMHILSAIHPKYGYPYQIYGIVRNLGRD